MFPSGRVRFDGGLTGVGAVAAGGKRSERRWCSWGARKTVALGAIAITGALSLSAISSPAANASACKLTYTPRLLAVGQNGTAYIDEFVQEIQGPNVPVGTTPCVLPSDIIVKRTRTGAASVIAGKIGNQGRPVPGRATASPVYEPQAGAVDSHGNLYVSQISTSAVLKITPSGHLSVVAGEIGKSGPPTPGTATHSRLNAAWSLAVDASNNLYIADAGNDVVEEVTPEGQLSILAGEVRKEGQPTAGPASQSVLINPDEVAVDQAGDVFVGSNAGPPVGAYVSEISPQGQLTAVAGNGSMGIPSQGVEAVDSPLGVIRGIAASPSGSLLLATGRSAFDPAFALVEVNASGTVTLLPRSVYRLAKGAAAPAVCGRIDTGIWGVRFTAAGNALFTTGGPSRADACVVEVTPQGKLSVLAHTYSK